MNISKLIKKYALQNAYFHDGKAQIGAVVSKVLGEQPTLKNKIKELIQDVKDVIEEVNKLSKKEQEKELQKIDKSLLIRKKEEKKEFKDLTGAIKGKFVVRLPPGPEKYPHLGHAISYMINYLYAKKYSGKVWLRFEDTNPKTVKKEFYDAIREDIKKIGIKWDYEKNISQDMEIFYQKAEHLIKTGNAYVCTCDVETMRNNRLKGVECKHRNQTVEENLKLWKKMFTKFKSGEAVLRLKGDMKAKNTTFRDPTLLRIDDTKHALTGKKYRVWPSYDFAVAIEEQLCGVTHVLRSSEFLIRTPLQKHIMKLLGYKKYPVYIHWARFNIIGGITKGREIRKLVEKENISWDDPRLMTIRAILRRGILPETIKELALNVGISTSPKKIEWKMLASINRKLLDPVANRYYFVNNPIKIKVENAPKLRVKLKLHPNKNKYRILNVESEFYITKEDYDSIKEGEIFSLKDLYNVKKENDKFIFQNKGFLRFSKKIQWVPYKENVKIKVLKPVGSVLEEIVGFGEKNISKIKIGEIVQFERFGFVRKDSRDTFIFTHK